MHPLFFCWWNSYHRLQIECLRIWDSDSILYHKHSRSLGHDSVRCDQALLISSAERVHPSPNIVCLWSYSNRLLLCACHSILMGYFRCFDNNQYRLHVQYDNSRSLDQLIRRVWVQEYVAWLGAEHTRGTLSLPRVRSSVRHHWVLSLVVALACSIYQWVRYSKRKTKLAELKLYGNSKYLHIHVHVPSRLVIHYVWHGWPLYWPKKAWGGHQVC